MRHGRSVTFALAAYDRSPPLVIDPVLSFATVFGGGGSDEGRAIAVDSTGATYVVGNAGSGNSPVVNGQPAVSGNFLAKINPAGGLYHSTDAGASFIIMPGLRVPIVNAIAIDPTNTAQIYVGTQFNPSDAFVVKITP